MEIMEPKLKRVLVFFRLIDANDGNISFTNIALMIVLAKLCTSHDTSVMDLGALLVALANFNVKKVINSLNAVQTVEDKLIQKSNQIS